MPAFPFPRLPVELRVQVYRYLLHTIHGIRIDSSEALRKEIWRRCEGGDLPEHGMAYRDMYRVTAVGLYPSILSVNWQTYLEAVRVLHSENRFEIYRCESPFDIIRMGATIPFLEDRSEGSRRLIREIEYLYVDAKSILYDYPLRVEHDRVFEKTCDYLGQNLQLQQVTLRFIGDFTSPVRSSVDCELCLANLNKLDLVQRLVPFVKKLKTFTLLGMGEDVTEFFYAAKTYLDSKMAEASNTPCQIQIAQWESRSVA